MTYNVKSAIYFPTKGRPELVRRAIGRVRQHNASRYPVYAVTERDAGLGLRDITDMGAIPLWLPRKGRGIGYARQAIVEHAAVSGFLSLAMIDDDQLVSGNIEQWLAAARRPDVVGVGAFKSYYGLLYRGTQMVITYRRPNLWLHKGSAGYQAFALNVATTVALGGFDPRLRCFEDTELARKGIYQRGIPWFIYTGVLTADQKSRAAMRELGSSSARLADGVDPAIRLSHEIVHDRWPGYVSPPDRRFRCSWKQMIQNYTTITPWPLENIVTRRPWDWTGHVPSPKRTG